MANFIERTLEPGEQVIYKGHLHWSYNVRYTVWGTLLVLAGIAGMLYVALLSDETTNNESYVTVVTICVAVCVIGMCVGGFGYFMRSRTEFAVTNTRFIQKDGILNIKMTEIPLFKVETVNFYQTLWERMFGTGSIELVGSGGTNHKVDYIQDPFRVRNIVTTYMKAANNAHKADATTGDTAE